MFILQWYTYHKQYQQTSTNFLPASTNSTIVIIHLISMWLSRLCKIAAERIINVNFRISHLYIKPHTNFNLIVTRNKQHTHNYSIGHSIVFTFITKKVLCLNN